MASLKQVFRRFRAQIKLATQFANQMKPGFFSIWDQKMPKIRIFIKIYRAIPQKNRRILLSSNLQENFRKIASVERNDETRDFLVNKILAVALMSQR